MRGTPYRLPRWMAVAMILAGCTAAPPPPAATGGGAAPPAPPPDPPAEFASTHHAVVEGVVASRGGQPLDSVTVVAWRMAGDRGMLEQTRVETDAGGRFRLPLQAHVGPEPAMQTRVVIRGFAYASRYPRGPGGSVALDSATIPVTLVPMGQAPPVANARITLPLP
ncbi:MAG TPA: hypothetical protein VF006_13835 [Longimicrobium sp.]